MDTTFILTDYDGVFAPIAQMEGEQVWPEREIREMKESHGATHSFYVYPEMLRRFRSLLEMENVEAYWLTTWRGETSALNSMLGLDLEEAGTVEDSSYHLETDWKFAMARRAYESGMKIVWFEDEVSQEAWEYLRKEKATKEGTGLLEITNPQTGGRLLIVHPVSHEGVSPEHMDAVEIFAFDGE